MHNYNTIEKENSYEYDGNTNEVLEFKTYPDQKENHPNIELKTNLEGKNNKPLMDKDSSSQAVPTSPCLKKMTTYENMIDSYKNQVDSVLKSRSTMLNSYKDYGSNMPAQPIKTILDTSNSVITAQVTSITNTIMTVPVIGKYLPCLAVYQESDQ